MVFIDFPIYGPLRFPLLIIEWINTVISLELGIIFFMKYLKQQNQLRTSQELGFSFFFFDFFLMRLFLINSDYYSSNFMISPFIIWSSGSFRDLFLNFGYMCLIFGAFILIFFIEKYKKYAVKKFFFSICLGSLVIFFYFLFLFDLIIIRISLFIYGPIILLFITIFFIDFFKKVKGKQNILFNLLTVIPPIFLLSIGIIFSTDFFLRLFGLEFKLFGAVLQLISFGLISRFFIRLPPFSEFDWQDKVEEILLIDKNSGLCAFYKSFIDKDAKLSEVLISGAITSVNIMLEELIPATDAKISIIEKKGKIVNIFSSKFLTGVFISREKLNSLIFHLEQFIKKVEGLYRHILLDWDGNLDLFYPVENIVNEMFSK